MAAIARLNPEWSKSYKCPPQDNIISHRYAKSRPFTPSYEKINTPVSMNLLLAWEYARIWEGEHNAYLLARKEAEKVRIVKRKPMKKIQKASNKNDRSNNRSSKTLKTSSGLGRGGGTRRKAGWNKVRNNARNCGIGTIVTGEMNTCLDPELYTGDLDCKMNNACENVHVL